LIAVSLLLLIFCTTLSTSPSVTFSNGTAVYRPASVYEQRAHELLSASLGSRSKFTINTTGTEEKLLKEFPELAAVHISLPIIGRRPNIIVVPRTPALILTTASKALVLDAAGRAVTDAAHLSPAVKASLPTVEDANKLELAIGEQAVTSDTVMFIQQVVAQFKAKQITIDRISLPAIANELDIRLKDTKYFIKCDVAGNARQQIGAYLAVKESGVTPAEYIDVRVEEKVFYK
jgi:hypothetical protein